MLTLLASVFFVASTCEYSPQIVCDESNSIKDVSALVALYIAAKQCPRIDINGQKALDQAGDVALFITDDTNLAANMVNSIGNAMTSYSSSKPNSFCEDATKTLESYSDEYLRWYGIIE